MGFDVVYLPPIHPIGKVHRKGRNNSPTAAPGDVGSPWAIGSDEGGHDAIHPEPGHHRRLRRLRRRGARAGHGGGAGPGVAVRAGPSVGARTTGEWFTELPDGTIAYAENPPKKYQDIYPLNFDNDPAGLYDEVLRVVRHWMDHGVKFFRVDNPHTKPPNFWAWLIAQVEEHRPRRALSLRGVHAAGPAVRPGQARLHPVLQLLHLAHGQVGAHRVRQRHRRRSPTFAGRTCSSTPPTSCTPSCSTTAPGMFAIRAVLAATMGPAWGVYSGYELFEHRAVREGSEEYLDSEKYELRPRDFAGALAEGRSLEPFITRLNSIRRLHPALQQLRTIHFHGVDNDALLAYSKFDPATGDCVLVVVTLNAFGAEEGTLWLDMAALGMEPYERFWVRDEITGQEYQWGQANYVRIDPARAVAHIINMPLIPHESRMTLLRRR